MSDPIDNLPNDTEDTSIADAWREIAEELFSTPGSTKQEQQDDRFDLLELPGPIRSYPCKDAFQRLQACYLSQSSKCEQRWKEFESSMEVPVRITLVAQVEELTDSVPQLIDRPARFVCQKELRILQEYVPADSLEYAEHYERLFFRLWDCWTDKFQHFRNLERMLIERERAAGNVPAKDIHTTSKPFYGETDDGADEEFL